jgi:hypothetical protein
MFRDAFMFQDTPRLIVVVLKGGIAVAIEDLEPTKGLNFARNNPRKGKLCKHLPCSFGARCRDMH